MNKYRRIWQDIILKAIREETGVTVGLEKIVLETPPRPELGDIGFPVFTCTEIFKKPPRKIAEILAGRIKRSGEEKRGNGTLEVLGPYLNVRLNKSTITEAVLTEIRKAGDLYGRSDNLQGQRIIVEFSAPNTNKPLHLGHLRNDAIGMSVARILEANGATVLKANLINDRGIHICKSMLAYLKFGRQTDPEKEKVKGDHLVGDYYVRFNDWAKKDPDAEEAARQMLKTWEEGDPELKALWRKMNDWAIAGIEETYRNTGVVFDRVYHESDTYSLGRNEVLEGLRKNIFYKEKDGSIWVDLSGAGLDKKVLLRSDGTSLYLTQDLGTAVQRYRDWPFDRMIYVVGSEQVYHFKVLFKVLGLLGYEWSKKLHHLAYGMVNLSEGKMKSREGTVVDADDLLVELKDLVAAEIREKEREAELEDPEETSRQIALAALNYYLLQVSPYKDIMFKPRESISFSGNTGPYLQYTGARMSSILRKFKYLEKKLARGSFRPELLNTADEWEIIKSLASYPETVALSARELNPALLAGQLYELAKTFSRYYHDHQVLHNESSDLVITRITLVQGILQVLKNGLQLIGIPLLEKM